MSIEIVLFDKANHDRTNFDCGEPAINDYLKKQLSPDLKSNACRCFILKEVNKPDVIGYITLSASSIESASIPEDSKKGLPKYPRLPSLLIGRMGVDKNHKGNKYGDLLVIKATEVAKNANMGVTLVEVEAKNSGLISYYQRLGFILLETTGKYDVLVKKI